MNIIFVIFEQIPDTVLPLSPLHLKQLLEVFRKTAVPNDLAILTGNIRARVRF